MSVVTDVADSIVAELNAATLSISITAERKFVPSFALQEMANLHVTVVPKGVSITKSDRSRNTHDVMVDVAVQKKFDKGDSAEIDPLMNLVDEIADLFRLKRLTSYPAAHWLKTEHAPIYSQEHWDEMRQFTSVLTFTFRVVR
jgi:hypothetical protein